MNRRDGFGLVAVAMMFALTSPVAALQSILGVWLTEERESRIEFVECGSALCGQIIWLQRERDEHGQPYRDVNNPNAALRDRPILGLTIFQNLVPDEESTGWRGTVYNPQDGDTYETIVFALPDGRLEVKGCVLSGFICNSEYWTPSVHPNPEGASN